MEIIFKKNKLNIFSWTLDYQKLFFKGIKYFDLLSGNQTFQKFDINK
jgi:hypothetical protein